MFPRAIRVVWALAVTLAVSGCAGGDLSGDGPRNCTYSWGVDADVAPELVSDADAWAAGLRSEFPSGSVEFLTADERRRSATDVGIDATAVEGLNGGIEAEFNDEDMADDFAKAALRVSDDRLVISRSERRRCEGG